MSRRERLFARLTRDDAELRDVLVPILRDIAAGRNTGFFALVSGAPGVLAQPVLAKANDILELAAQLAEPVQDLVAAAVVRAFDQANDLANEQRLGPIRLAKQLLRELGGDFDEDK